MCKSRPVVHDRREECTKMRNQFLVEHEPCKKDGWPAAWNMQHTCNAQWSYPWLDPSDLPLFSVDFPGDIGFPGHAVIKAELCTPLSL